MKIIIAGIGKVGTTLTRQLTAEGYDLTVIDSNPTVLSTLVERFDVIGVHGNCASMPVLLQAGVEEADLLIATTDADEKNLLCCMTAQGINKELQTSARIRNPDYTEQVYGMLDVFSLSLVINPERQAAREMERLLKFPGFFKRDTFAKGRVEIVEVRVDSKSPLRDIPLHQFNAICKVNVLVCSVIRRGAAVTPDGNFVLQEGDRLFITAATDKLQALLRQLNIIQRKVQHVMLCGGGRASLHLAQALMGSDIGVTIVEQNYDRCQYLADHLPRATIVHGDASDQSILQKERVDQCDALIAMTGMDELNIVISLYAQKSQVPQVITKLSHIDATNPLLEGLELGSVVSPKELCCSRVVRYVRAMKNQTGAATSVHTIADGNAEALEFSVPRAYYCNRPLKELTLRPNTLVAAITRGRDIIIPDGNASLQPGDGVIVVSSGTDVVHQLHDVFL